jgi:hypothetical protein
MKAAVTDTLDSMIVERLLKKQNLCLDKGYDFPQIERESIKDTIYHTYVREEKIIA